MAFTAGFSVNVGDPTKASDVDVLAANDDYLKNAIDTFIANDANNRVLTGTGSGTANAETNLTFDGSTLTVTGTVSATTFSGNVTGGTISGTTATFTGGLTGTTATFSGLISGNGGAEIGSNTAKVKFYSDSTYSGIYNGSSLVSDESYYFGSGDHLWYSDGAVAMKIDNGDLAVGTDKLFVDVSASAVGVGTSSPAGLGARSLNIKAPASNGADLTLEADNGTNFGVLFSGATTNDPFSIYSNTGFKFATASDKNATGYSEHMRLTSAGLLGIGTDSPTGLLNLIADGATPYAGSASILLDLKRGVTNTGSSNNTAIRLGNNSNGFQISYGGSDDHLQFLDGGNNAVVTMTNSGNRVGIGTSSPSTLLQLNETYGTAALSISDDSSAGDYLTFQIVGGQYNGGANEIQAINTTDLSLNVATARSLIFKTNNTERARITSAGNFEVTKSGSAEGLAKFESNDDVSIKLKSTFGASNGAGIFLEFDDAFTSATEAFYLGVPISSSEFGIGYGTKDAFTVANAKLTVTRAGNVGIGSQSPTYKLVVSNGGAAGYEFNVNGLNSGVNTLTYNRSTSAYVDSAHFVDNYYIYSGQTPAERFRVESTGVCAFMTSNVNIRFNGTATSTVLTDNNGVEIYTGGFIWAARQATSLYLSRAGSTGEIAAFRYNAVTQVGSISVTSTATAYNTSSDYRLKENLVPITGAVDRVNALQPRRFNFISDPDTTVDGFVAHEVSPIVPESVNGEKDAVDEDGNPEYQGIDQSKLVPLLTAAIQELTARIEALEAS